MSRCWCACDHEDVNACAEEENRLMRGLLSLGDMLFRDEEAQA